MDTPANEAIEPTPLPADLPPLPPIADLVSREIRRMGRAWKIEGTKSLLHVALTMMVMTVLGAGWMIFFTALAGCAWTLWSKFSLKATIKPYKRRRAKPDDHDADNGDEETADDAGEQYSNWLTDSPAAAVAGLNDVEANELRRPHVPVSPVLDDDLDLGGTDRDAGPEFGL